MFLPALYIGVFLLLAGLIFRGIAFEFRFKASARNRYWWNAAFSIGSFVAAFAQGAVVGSYIQGFKTENMRYVNFEGNPRLIGQFVDIRITEVRVNTLRGEVVTA